MPALAGQRILAASFDIRQHNTTQSARLSSTVGECRPHRSATSTNYRQADRSSPRVGRCQSRWYGSARRPGARRLPHRGSRRDDIARCDVQKGRLRHLRSRHSVMFAIKFGDTETPLISRSLAPAATTRACAGEQFNVRLERRKSDQ